MSRNRLKKWGRGNQLLNWFKRYFTNYYSPRKHRTQRGIALPLVIGVGLLMTLLSITIIVRSQSSQVSTSNLKQAAQASEAAEAGVAKVQEIFTSSSSQYRQLSRITLENLNSNDTTWSNATGTFPAACGTTTADITSLVTTIKEYRKKDDNKWIALDSQRRFRIVAYDYALTATSGATTVTTVTVNIPASTVKASVTMTDTAYLTNGSSVYGQINGIPGILARDTSGNYTFKASVAPSASTGNITSSFYPISNGSANKDSGLGNLWIEGQIVSDTSAASPTVYSRAGLQVGIPVSPGNILSVPIPGTWIASSYSTLGNEAQNQFDSDNLMACGTDLSGVTVTAGHTKKTTEVSLPDLPEIPSTAAYILSSVAANNSLTANNKDYVLPATTGANTGYNSTTGAYEYIIQDITGKSLTINPNYKVNIYLQGDLQTDVDFNKYADYAQSSLNPIYNPSTSPTTTVTINGGISIGADNSTGATVVPSNTSYLTTNNQFVYGRLGTANIPGKLQVAITTTGTPPVSVSTYTFTPTDAGLNGAIRVTAGSTFTPQPQSFQPTNFQLFGYKSDGYLCINGANRSIYAFILAPGYGAGVNGASNPAFTGAIWVGGWREYANGTQTRTGGPNFPCNSAANTIVVSQSVTWDNISGLAPFNLPPIVSPMQTWNKKEVN